MAIWPRWPQSGPMKSRAKRAWIIMGGLLALGVATALVLNAFRNNLVFFFSPSQVAQNQAPHGRYFRLGGVVQEGSVRPEAGTLIVQFVITDRAREIPRSEEHTSELQSLMR